MSPQEMLQKFLADVESSTGHKSVRRGDEYSCRCPSHDDSSPSLGVKIGDVGLVVHCLAGCSCKAVCNAVNWKETDLFFNPINRPAPVRQSAKKAPAPSPPKNAEEKQTKRYATLEQACNGRGTPTRTYVYKDAAGNDSRAAMRWDTNDGKTFSQFTRFKDGWANSGSKELSPLYRLPELLASNSNYIFVVEGEKCVDAMYELGLTATTSIGGSQNAKGSDWATLTGKNVVIIPDNDEAGKKYANDVKQHLAILRPIPTCRTLILPDLAKSEDIFDFIEQKRRSTWNNDQIACEILSMAGESRQNRLRPPDDYVPRPQFISEFGDQPDYDWIWKNFIAKGAISMLCGLWKSGKTTLLSSIIRTMQNGGDILTPVKAGKVLVVTEEMARTWVKRQGKFKFGENLKIEMAHWMRKPDETQWAEYVGRLFEYCESEKVDLLIIDPFMRISPIRDENNSVDVGMGLAPLCVFKDSETAVLLTHHSKKGEATTIEQLARGSGEFQAFVEIVIYFQKLPKTRGNTDKHKRKLNLVSRDMPEEFDGEEGVIIELNSDGMTYSACGSESEDRENSTKRTIFEMLPMNADDAMTVAEIRERLEDFGKAPSKNTARKYLNDMVREKHLSRITNDKRNEPEKYFRRL